MMTIISFNYLFLFLTVSGVVSDKTSMDKESKVVQEYSSEVKTIHRYGDVYGVLLQNTVKLQRFTSVNGTIKTEDLGRILLDKRKHGQSLIMSKLINNNTALYCSDRGCSICTKSDSVSCNEIWFQDKALYCARAEVNQNKLFLTTIENNFNTSINVFQLNEDIYKIELKNKYYEDYEKQNQYGRKLIGSFSTPEYVYFLGDFIIAGHPVINAKYSHEIANIISRYCVDDDTPQLDSRIDVVLSCENGHWRTVTAFDFDTVSNKLFVSFSVSSKSGVDPFICEFDFEEIQQQFDEAWQSFRKTDYLKTKNRQHCSIEAEKGVCAVIRAQNSSDICAQGSVFHPTTFFGKKVFSSTRPYHISWLRRFLYPGVFLGETANQLLTKITGKYTEDGEQISRIETIADAVSPFYDPYLDGNIVLYVPANIRHLLMSYQLVPQNLTKIPISERLISAGKVMWLGLFLVPIIVVIVISTMLLQKWRKLRIEHKNSHAYKSIPISDMSKTSPVLTNIAQLRYLNDKIPIGTGHSGDVFRARFYVDINNDAIHQEIAVKEIDFYDDNVLREIDILKTCRHKNIVSFIGDLIEGGKVLIGMEYMEGGSLVSYLKNISNQPTIGTCFTYMMQALSGMVYLSENGIIHRDLAARNCLLNAKHDVLKICDFGLSRKTVDDVYVSVRNQFLPFQWLPMENLKDNRLFHMKTDIWMFGILAWELFTRASKPYENLGVDTVDSLYNYLSQGNRLAKPPHCPTKLFDIMLRCWKADKDQRPTFVELENEIADLLKSLQNSPEKKLDHVYINLGLNHTTNNDVSLS